MIDSAYWIWASGAMGAGAFTGNLFGAFADARELFEASPAEHRMSGVFTPSQLRRLASPSLDDARRLLRMCEKNGWQCLGFDDPRFPECLRRLPDSPLVIYVSGNVSAINDGFRFGIVGTRNPTPESVNIARTISAELADAGAVIVSGGALGIDSAAHEGALDVNGKTVCVLGCGLGTRYLMENDSLRRRIASAGAVISEFAPLSPASRVSFPIRNRIISGLSSGILVVEAGEKSGSIITANCAFEQGREVFAVPGSVTTSAYAGANRLIRDGARVAACAEDIIRDFSELMPGALRQAEKKPAVPGPSAPVKRSTAGLSEDEKSIYSLFGTEPVYPGELSAASGLPITKVMTVLTTLELKDYIASLSGGRYSLI